MIKILTRAVMFWIGIVMILIGYHIKACEMQDRIATQTINDISKYINISAYISHTGMVSIVNYTTSICIIVGFIYAMAAIFEKWE